MTMPRILVGVTTYDKKDYVFERCIAAVRAFDYPKDRIDTIIVDNTVTLDYYRKLRRRGHRNVHHTERGANSREALTKAQNYIRDVFLKGDYDYLLFVESDLIPQPDTVRRLLSYGVPVAGSTYYIGHEVKVPCIFITEVRGEHGGFTATRPIGLKQLSDGRKYHDPHEVKDFLAEPGLRRVHGCGFGCTLIERRIVVRYPFWYDNRFDDKHSDVYFYLNLENDKVPVFVDTTVVVPHYPSRWEDVLDR